MRRWACSTVSRGRGGRRASACSSACTSGGCAHRRGDAGVGQASVLLLAGVAEHPRAAKYRGAPSRPRSQLPVCRNPDARYFDPPHHPRSRMRRCSGRLMAATHALSEVAGALRPNRCGRLSLGQGRPPDRRTLSRRAVAATRHAAAGDPTTSLCDAPRHTGVVDRKSPAAERTVRWRRAAVVRRPRCAGAPFRGPCVRDVSCFYSRLWRLSESSGWERPRSLGLISDHRAGRQRAKRPPGSAHGVSLVGVLWDV